jgi:hypothetical protein
VVSRFLAADLVTGPECASCEEIDSRSDGVGLGEMTRGVAGTEVFPRIDMP